MVYKRQAKNCQPNCFKKKSQKKSLSPLAARFPLLFNTTTGGRQDRSAKDALLHKFYASVCAMPGYNVSNLLNHAFENLLFFVYEPCDCSQLNNKPLGL